MAVVALQFSSAPLLGLPANLVFGESLNTGLPSVGVVDSNLVFKDAANSSLPSVLVFKPESSAVIEHPVVTLSLTLASGVKAPTLRATLGVVKALRLASTIQAPRATSRLRHTNAVYRGPAGTTNNFWQPAIKLSANIEAIHQTTLHRKATVGNDWQQADRLHSIAETSWVTSDRLRGGLATNWQDGTQLGHYETDSYSVMLKRRQDVSASHQVGLRVETSRKEEHETGIPTSGATSSTFQKAVTKSFARKDNFGKAITLKTSTLSYYQQARKPPPGLFVYVTPVVPVDHTCYTPPRGSLVPLVFKDGFATNAALLFACLGTTIPPSTATVVIPVRKDYIVLNAIKLVRVSGELELPATALTLNIDMDSWNWGFTASLPASALSLVEPDSNGDPMMLRADINGQSYLLLAESLSRTHVFGKKEITISGRGQSAMLATPYTKLTTFKNTEARTAQQLMNDALTINGVSIGWTVDWRINDWVVPTGCWSHQGSYITAITTIAEAAGAFVQPDPLGKTLRIRPRFPVAPWDWYAPTTIPDLQLPTAAVTREGVTWVDKPKYNAVYVSGTTTGGILGHVKRVGSAADNEAQMVTDALITHAIAARQRALPILAEVGRIATYSLSLPVFPEGGIIDPGTLLRYTNNGVPTMGVVKGVSVSTNFQTVKQTIEVQVHG